MSVYKRHIISFLICLFFGVGWSAMGQAPTITGISAPTGSYKQGDVINITITFSQNVTVTGTPQLTLNIGGSDVVVDYKSGSGSANLVFEYIVLNGHNTAALEYKATNSLVAPGVSFGSPTYINDNMGAVRSVVTFNAGGSGKYVYIGDASSSTPGIHSVNITNPGSPTYDVNSVNNLSITDLTQSATRIWATHNGTIGLGTGFLYGYDIALGSPNSLNYAGRITNNVGGGAGYPYGIDINVVGGVNYYAYVADERGGVIRYNITNPASIGYVNRGATGSGATVALKLTIDGNYAYGAYNAQFRILDISNLGSGVTVVGGETMYAEDVDVSGNYAYVASDTDGLKIVNITDKTNPVVSGTADTGGRAFGVTLSGDYAYVADGTAGLAAVNISNPASPTIDATVALNNVAGTEAYDVAIFENYAYVANEKNLASIPLTLGGLKMAVIMQR